MARICEANPQSFLTAKNKITAVVFTYFIINYCEADNMSERREMGLVFGSFFEKERVGAKRG